MKQPQYSTYDSVTHISTLKYGQETPVLFEGLDTTTEIVDYSPRRCEKQSITGDR